MTAVGFFQDDLLVRDPELDALLGLFPTTVPVFTREIFFEMGLLRAKLYLLQRLSASFVAGIPDDLEAAWGYLHGRAITVPEGRERLATLGVIKLPRTETSGPRTPRRKTMTEQGETPAKEPKSGFNARTIKKGAKIRLLTKENPRKKDSKTFAIYALYQDGMTVEEFLKAGGRLVDIKADIVRKHVELYDIPADEPKAAKKTAPAATEQPTEQPAESAEAQPQEQSSEPAAA